MEPTNQPQRKTAIGKFFGMYLFSLIFPVGGMYMLNAVPDSMSNSESGRYKLIVDEQQPIVSDADTLGNFAKKLLQQDGLAVSSPDPAVKGEATTKIVELESQIKDAMNRIKGKQVLQVQNQSLSKGVASMAEVIVALRSNMSDLRLSLAKNGVDMSAINQKTTENQMKDMKISQLEGQIKQLEILAKAGGGGGGGADPMVPILKSKVAQLENSLKSSGGGGAEILRLQQKLDDCNNAPRGGGSTQIVQGIPAADMLKYAEAEGYAALALRQTKKFSERSGFFNQAVAILEDLENASVSKEMKNKARDRRIKLEANEGKIPD